MRRRSPGGFETACEDVGVAESAGICAVCHRSKIRGDRNDSGDVFICSQCQADAAQSAMQDTITDEADPAAAIRRNSTDQQHQRRSQR